MAADSVGWVIAHRLGGPAEMLLPGQRDEEFELVDHWQSLSGNRIGRQQRMRINRPRRRFDARRLCVDGIPLAAAAIIRL